MKAFERYNPIVITVYFLSASLILMFSQNPVLLLEGLLGVIAYSLMRGKGRSIKAYAFYLALFVVLSLVNPIFSHKGETVLFVMNDSPITLEAFAYGMVSAGLIITVLLMFGIFTDIMTRDKLLYVFGKLSPKLALIFSMGLRYIPLLCGRAKKIGESQRALGLYKDDNIFDKTKSDLRVFSILITWALENGITTADSMSARGYGKKKRSYYSLFGFGKSDAAVLILTILCAALTLVGMAFGTLDFIFYPSFGWAELTPLGVAAYAAYGMLAALPAILETEERIKWKYLQSRL